MNSIIKAQELKAALDSLRPIDKEKEAIIMQKFRLDWNYHSNHLEGNALTYGETKALILFNITANAKPLRDHFEMTGHNDAILWVLEVVKEERPLTENFIRELHQLILKEPYYKPAITPNGEPTKKLIKVGEYKSDPNHVLLPNGEMFYFASPEETPAKMNDLMDWLAVEKAKQDLNPILLAAEFHYKFIRIHPFDDGNGRTARILMNFILLQYGYPPVIVKTGDKEKYFAVLSQADAGLLEPFVHYIADNLVHSLELMIRGAEGKIIDEEDDLDKEIALLEQRIKSQNNKVEEKKNHGSLKFIYENGINVFVERLIEMFHKFDKFFLYNDLEIVFHGKSEGGAVTVNAIPLIFKITTENINFIYEFKKLLTGADATNLALNVDILLNSMNYQIADSNGNIVISKAYNEGLTKDDIAYFIKVQSKIILDLIEEKIPNS